MRRPSLHDQGRAAAAALLWLPGRSGATGSEMAGLALVLPVLFVMVAGALVALAWLAYVLLPAAWSKGRRWRVALLLAPLGVVLLALLSTGRGLVQMALARFIA